MFTSVESRSLLSAWGSFRHRLLISDWLMADWLMADWLIADWLMGLFLTSHSTFLLARDVLFLVLVLLLLLHCRASHPTVRGTWTP